MTEFSTPLQNQVAVVTGGSRGIGAAIAKKLANMGAKVIIIGRNREALDHTAKEISRTGGTCEGCQFDVTSVSEVQSLATYVARNYGKVEILVNNAGSGGFGRPLHETDPEVWDRVINTNLRGVYYCMRSFSPMMIDRKYGHIINISSLASKNPVPNAAAYCASKWGLNGLSYSAAEELRNFGVRVSIVCPGSTNTELRRAASGDTDKMLEPEDVAHVVAMMVTQSPRSFASEVLLRPTLKP